MCVYIYKYISICGLRYSLWWGGLLSGHLGDPADVLFAVLHRESEIVVQPVSHMVAIQHIGQTFLPDECFLQRPSDRGLPSPGRRSGSRIPIR